MRQRQLLQPIAQGRLLFGRCRAHAEQRAIHTFEVAVPGPRQASVPIVARPADPEQRAHLRHAQTAFTKKNGKTSFGYKVHIGTDEGSDLIRRAVMTTAQLHDSQAGDTLIQGDEAAVYPDQAYDDGKRRERLKARGIEARILYKARRNKPFTTRQKCFNKTAAVVRAAVERPFALMKGPYRFARCRYLGLARNDAHLQLFASADNLKTAMVLVR